MPAGDKTVRTSFVEIEAPLSRNGRILVLYGHSDGCFEVCLATSPLSRLVRIGIRRSVGAKDPI